jgi:carbonic anhydrase
MRSIAIFFLGCLFLIMPVTADAKAIWTYDEDYTGQEDWGSISPIFDACEKGTGQSPIQIGQTRLLDMPPLKPGLGTAEGKVHFIDHTVEVVLASTHRLKVADDMYALKTIRFHSPSEHMIRDIFYPLEIHLMFENGKRKRLFIAVFAELGAENPAIGPIFALATKKSPAASDLSFDLSALMPQADGYWAYDGSLTYPPCSENVAWRVMKKPITLSQPQLKIIGGIIGRNARLTQPVYLRTVSESAK